MVGEYHDCSWKMAGQTLRCSQSFTCLGMLFHEDRKIKPAAHARFSKVCASRSVGLIFSRYFDLHCANRYKLLVKLQQAILQPCATYGCEAWASADCHCSSWPALGGLISAACLSSLCMPCQKQCPHRGHLSGFFW